MKNPELSADSNYKSWLVAIKQTFQKTQLKAVVRVNATLLEFCWQLGSEIVEKQKNTNWGDGFLKQLSKDLSVEFIDVKGFSKRNLELIRKWFIFWNNASQITKQVVSQLNRIPWGHNIAIVTKSRSYEEALYYVQSTIEQGWSRSVLIHQM